MAQAETFQTIFAQREAALNAGDASEYNRLDALLRATKVPACGCGAPADEGRYVAKAGDYWRACAPCADAVREAA